jgi:putative transcriptional regulator
MSVSLAPGFLVAMPDLRDPNFFRSVILLCTHTSEGAFGLIVNHALDLSVAAICAEAGISWPHRSAPPAFCGGPVDRQRGWVIHDPDVRFPDTQLVDDGLALSASRDALKAYAREPGGRFRLVLGHAGWGPAQLDAEFATGSWLAAGSSPDLVFATPAQNAWSTTLARLGIHDTNALVGGSTRVH